MLQCVYYNIKELLRGSFFLLLLWVFFFKKKLLLIGVLVSAAGCDHVAVHLRGSCLQRDHHSHPGWAHKKCTALMLCSVLYIFKWRSPKKVTFKTIWIFLAHDCHRSIIYRYYGRFFCDVCFLYPPADILLFAVPPIYEKNKVNAVYRYRNGSWWPMCVSPSAVMTSLVLRTRPTSHWAHLMTAVAQTVEAFCLLCCCLVPGCYEKQF